jgi:uncharacterized protein YecT (DUF1311 family)
MRHARHLPITLVLLLLALPQIGHADDLPRVECTQALSTAEMNQCASAEFAKADAELNAAYQTALKTIPGMATGDPPWDAKSWETALRNSQRAWVAFRDAECDIHVAMFWTNGSGATVDILGCKTEKTEARTRELKDRYEAR